MAGSQAFQNLIVTVTPGERIFTEGEIGTTMFIVQSGRVLLFRDSGGKRATVAEMEKGDFFGEMSLLEGTPRNMCAEAVEPAELIEINSTTFDRMIRSNVEIAVRLLRKLSGRLQKAESLIVLQRAQIEQAGAAPSATSAPIATPAPPAVAEVPVPARIAASAGPSTAVAVADQPPIAAAAAARSVPAPAPQVQAGVPPAHTTVVGPGSLSATRPPAPIPQASRGGPGGPTIRIAAAAPVAAKQGPRLVSESGETVFPLSSNDALLGRYDPVTETQPEVDLTLVDVKRSVSRRHARVTHENGGFYLIEEVGALNGTFINGAKLTTGKASPLQDEDRVSLGTVNLVFRI